MDKLRTEALHPVTADREWLTLAQSAEYRAGELATLTGVSLRTLQRRFKSQYGVTVSTWLKAVRLQTAGQKIRAGVRVKEVALELGYKQLSHFSREFKRAYGHPPTTIAKEVPNALKKSIAHHALTVTAPRVTHMLNSGPR